MRCEVVVRSILLAVAVFALLSTRAASAADLVDKSKLDALVGPIVDQGWVYGVSIGLINEHGTQLAGYGHVSESNAAPPSGDTLFEIGSITKVFTGLILAKMAQDGTVRLDQPVQELLGDSITVPTGERAITLVDIATHTSGLPRMPNNFAPKDANNPYADYTVEQMGEFLGKHKLRRQPGEKYEYSNLAVGLLGHALARKNGTSYEELLRKTICEPLGMTNTVIVLDDAHQALLAQGHDFDSKPTANWDLPTLAGAGAIRSSAADMLKFLAVNLGLEKTPLAAAIEASHKIRFENPNEADDLALGWHINGKKHIIWHDGGTGGYRSYCAFDPARKIGVVVLGSSAVGQVDVLGERIFKLLATGDAEPIKLPVTTPVTVEEIEPLVGKYQLGPLGTADVTRDGTRLFVQLTGQPKIGLYPETKTKFFCRAVEAAFDFQGDDGKIERMVIHQNGIDITAKRAP